MPCFRPWTAFFRDGVDEDGKYRFMDMARGDIDIQLPCGKCDGCRKDRARGWAARMMHEASMHGSNLFLTLTYDDDHLPHDMSVNLRDFQLFMKRLRKALSSPFVVGRASLHRPGGRLVRCIVFISLLSISMLVSMVVI